MTTAQVVETSVTVNNDSPIQDYVHPDDQTQPFEYCQYSSYLFTLHMHVLHTLFLQFRLYLSGPWYTLKCLFSTRLYVRFVVLLHGGSGGHFYFVYLIVYVIQHAR